MGYLNNLLILLLTLIISSIVFIQVAEIKSKSLENSKLEFQEIKPQNSSTEEKFIPNVAYADGIVSSTNPFGITASDVQNTSHLLTEKRTKSLYTTEENSPYTWETIPLQTGIRERHISQQKHHKLYLIFEYQANWK